MAPLWIGTNNPKKLAELTRLLAPLGVTLRTPKDLDAPFEPVGCIAKRNGRTFAMECLCNAPTNGIFICDTKNEGNFAIY